MEVKISTDGYSELLCPHCEGNYMHHSEVQVFNRKAEDSEEGNHITVKGDGFSADREMAGNPSSRRDGIVIRFWCEFCGGGSYLTISQHKGNTSVDFLPDYTKPPHAADDE